MKRSIFLFIFLSMFLGLKAQDIIYTVSGNYNQKKVPLDSIVVENVTNGKIISFRNLPHGDNYLINLSQNSFWGTVDVMDITKPPLFSVIKNVPGTLSFLYSGITQTAARISVININGQLMHTITKNYLFPGNSFQVSIGREGIYFVRIESFFFTNTYKAVGIYGYNDFNVSLSENAKILNAEPNYKIAEIGSDGDFSFNVGDSLRVWAYAKKSDVFAWPKMFKITESKYANFIFEDIHYANKMERANPDSVEEIVPFKTDNDIYFCEKVNGEYFFQGDIMIDEEDLITGNLKGAYLPNVGKWPDREIPYIINSELANDERIQTALEYWNLNSPVTFQVEPDGRKYVEFVKSQLGFSYSDGVGKNKNILKKRQIIGITDSAEYGEILHEMAHAAGLIHEQSRSDRDKYIYIIEDNIKDEYKPGTKIYEAAFGIKKKSKNVGSLDFTSLMIYDSDDGSNGKGPVMVKVDGSTFKSQRSVLSIWDIRALDEIYGTNSENKPSIIVTSELDPNNLSLTIIGEINDPGKSPVLSKSIAWKKVDEDQFNYKNLDASDEFKTVLTNLECGEEYIYYVSATNSYGTSSSVFCRQLILSYLIKVTDITSKSVKISAEINKCDCINRVILKSNRIDTPKDENDYVLPYNSDIFEIKVDNLTPNCTYKIYQIEFYPVSNSGKKSINVDISFETLFEGNQTGIFIDSRDNNDYIFVQIGSQVWMAENLAFLPAVNPASVPYPNVLLTDKYYYVYDYNSTDAAEAKASVNYTNYGVLYNWPAAMNNEISSTSNPSGVRGICPEGWHLPSDAEWVILENFLITNGYNFDGTNSGNKIGKAMAIPSFWNTCSIVGTVGNNLYENNRSGFSGLPAGLRNSTWLSFSGFGNSGTWWSSSEDPFSKFPLYRSLQYNQTVLSKSDMAGRDHGFSIRCVKD